MNRPALACKHGFAYAFFNGRVRADNSFKLLLAHSVCKRQSKLAYHVRRSVAVKCRPPAAFEFFVEHQLDKAPFPCRQSGFCRLRPKEICLRSPRSPPPSPSAPSALSRRFRARYKCREGTTFKLTPLCRPRNQIGDVFAPAPPRCAQASCRRRNRRLPKYFRRLF